MAAELLAADIPDWFHQQGLRIALNTHSGYVFMINEDSDTLMMNGDQLEGWFNSPYDGHEGFFEDLTEEADDTWNDMDIEWLEDIAAMIGEHWIYQPEEEE